MSQHAADLAVHTSYDEIPYPELSFSQTHPDALATVATLLGMQPADIEHCRVLELGCAGGGNLIPMAWGLPGSEFVGIDRSTRQIAEGQAAIDALGPAGRNITLHALDIMDLDGNLGTFDYIIAHGVFSWVPRPVQERLLAVCHDCLAPNGVVYISYNTYPGWHMIEIVRQAMLYHTRDVEDPTQRVARGREMIDLLAAANPESDSAYGSFMRTYAQVIDGKLEDMGENGLALLLHDELEGTNEPLYFYEFAERAAQHGLQYLGESLFNRMLGSSLPPEVLTRISGMARSVIDLEQYFDLAQHRTFRETLLCHADVQLNRTLQPDLAKGFYAASRARPKATGAEPKGSLGKADLNSTSVVQFEGPDGAVLSTDHPASKAALLHLAEIWPRAVSFDDLLSAAHARLGHKASAAQRELDADVLASNLLSAFGYTEKLVELHVHAPAIGTAGKRPLASPVARLQARGSGRITNLRHERVRVDELDRFLLGCLDGSRDRPALLERLLARPVPAGQPAQTQAELAGELEKRLNWLARVALLVAQDQN